MIMRVKLYISYYYNSSIKQKKKKSRYYDNSNASLLGLPCENKTEINKYAYFLVKKNIMYMARLFMMNDHMIHMKKTSWLRYIHMR